MDAPLALYRRYRPDVFSDVIGQDQVTVPLSHALDNNRVHHAYLFSGPRGCGKTTSARIMARSLNCEKGPTSTPCGSCESCIELASGGPGSIDVIEIDAASHGGVDDARDLRERAFFAPMKARYKVYIIDEAHMVSTQGFNALLKLVEEPPSHVRFIFATTEPDKVIGTIRSRTHHYPIRLVPPRVLGDYVVELSRREGVPIEPTAVPLVVRAGAGSVRDSLSVLDQLIGGSGPDGVTYDLATALLGYTPDSLLDETVDALSAGDGATLFGVIDKVVDAGQDPRRFAEDLLHRLRDLVVVSAVPDAASRGLIEMADDQAERLGGQAARFGRAELTRAADIVSQGLTEMRGATAPRLLLEIMCARILLPGMDDSAEGFGARLDRVERRMSVVGDAPAAAPARTTQGSPPAARPPATSPVPPSTEAPSERPLDESMPRGVQAPAPAAAKTPAADDGIAAAHEPSAPVEASPAAVKSAPEPLLPEPPKTLTPAAAVDSGRATAAATPSVGSESAGGAQLSLVDVRQLWPGVLDRVKKMKRMTWILLSGNAQVRDVRDGVLTIAFSEGARKNFIQSGHDEILSQALIDELGVAWKIEAIIDEAVSTGSARPAAADPLPETEQRPGPPSAHAPGTPARAAEVEAAKEAIRPTRSGGEPAEEVHEASTSDVHDDDDVIDDASVSSQELLARELGAKVIDDIRHDNS